MRKTTKTPEPGFIIICSETHNVWNEAQAVAPLGKPILFVGAFDCDEVIERVQTEFCYSSREDKGDGKVLLWKITDHSK